MYPYILANWATDSLFGGYLWVHSLLLLSRILFHSPKEEAKGFLFLWQMANS